MTDKPTKRTQVIARAVALLQAGILISALPQQLMTDFKITPAQATRWAEAAIKQHKRGGSDEDQTN